MKEIYEVTCRCCGETHFLAIRPRDVESWQNGELIQNAMPYLDADERELIISGTCGACWNKMFGLDIDDDIEEDDYDEEIEVFE